MPDSYASPELVAELTNRLNLFFQHLDERRYEEVLAEFAPQGRWLRQGRWLEGRDAILGALRARPEGMKVRHVMTNFVVRPQGEDCVHVDAYMTAFRQLPGQAPGLFRLNLVTNVFGRYDGQWLLLEQQLVPEFDFPQDTPA